MNLSVVLKKRAPNIYSGDLVVKIKLKFSLIVGTTIVDKKNQNNKHADGTENDALL